MKKYYRTFGLMLFICVGTFMHSCTCEDITNTKSNWAKNMQINPTLMGRVCTIGDIPVEGATVSIIIDGTAYSVSTDVNGRYTIVDLKNGNYEVTASYNNYVISKGTISLSNNSITTWNALVYEPSKTVTQKTMEDGSTTYSSTLPDVVNVATSKSQKVSVNVPAGLVTSGLNMESWYESVPSAQTKSSASFSGKLSCMLKTSLTDGTTHLSQQVKIMIYGCKSANSVFHNGVKVDYKTASDENGDFIYFYTKELGTTEFVFPIYKIDPSSENIPIVFNPSTIERTSDDIIKTTYSCKLGALVELQGCILDQYVAVLEGGVSGLMVYDMPLKFKLNIPVGEQVLLTGKQKYNTFKYKSGDMIVPVTCYGNVSYSVVDRQHTGGSN